MILPKRQWIALAAICGVCAIPAAFIHEIPPPRTLPAVPPQMALLQAPAGPSEPAGSGDGRVPDFRGKSMRDVVEETSAGGFDVMIEGSGVARAQLPLPGSPLRRGERIRIVFTR